jgi:large subunit ribosomal protein L9
MNVVLLKDVRDMGRAGAVVEVSSGHAINFLFPRKLAVLATPQAIKAAEQAKVQADERRVIDKQLLAQNMASLAEARIVLTMKANEKGHLYKSVSAADIVTAVQEQARIEIPEDAIRFESPLKEVGEHTIPLSIDDLFGSFVLHIEAEA